MPSSIHILGNDTEEPSEMPLTSEILGCPHSKFAANVTILFLQDLEEYRADVRIKCAACDMPFRFLGIASTEDIQAGVPVISPDGLRCALPIIAMIEEVSEVTPLASPSPSTAPPLAMLQTPSGLVIPDPNRPPRKPRILST